MPTLAITRPKSFTTYYGFKGNFIVTQGGYVLGYVITKASIHGAKEVEELILNTHPEERYVFADEDYIGKRLCTVDALSKKYER